MAYAFDRVMQVMGRKKQDEAPADAMGSQRAAGGPLAASGSPLAPTQQQAPQGQGGMAGDRVRAASVEGALPQGGGGAPSGQQAPQETQQTPASRGRLFQANAGRASSPVDLNAMGQQIESSKKRIQSAADQYVSNAGGFYGNQAPDYVKSAIQDYAGLSDNASGAMNYAGGIPAGGFGKDPLPPIPGSDDSGVWSAIDNPVASSSWIDAYTQGPGQVKQFANPYTQDITNADLISTDAGLGELFRRQGGAEYSAGDAAFDTALLRKNAAFNALRDQTLAQNRELQKLGIEIGDTATEKAQKALEASYGGWKGAVTGELEAASKALESRGGEAEKSFDAKLMAQREKAGKKAGKYAKDVIKQITKDNPQMGYQIQQAVEAGYDPSQFLDIGGLTDESTSWRDFLGDTQAKGWNNVMNLLGRGGDALSEGRLSAAKAKDYVKPSFNEAGFADMILGKAATMPGLVTESGKVDVPAIKLPEPTSKKKDRPYVEAPIPDWAKKPITPADLPTEPLEPLRPLPGVGPAIDITNKANQELKEKEDKAFGYVQDRIPKIGKKLY